MSERALSLGLLVVTLGLYLATSAPDLATTHDGGELTTAAATLGIAHPPGYPLYILLGHLASWLPVGSVAFRLNVFSALCAALGVTLLGMTFSRLWSQPSAGMLSALLGGLAVAPWRQAVGAEKYALHFLLAGALMLWATYRRQGRAPNWVGALLLGLALCHHHTIVLLLPALVVYLGDAPSDPNSIKTSLVAFLGGLVPLLYLPLRAQSSPAVNWGDPSTLERFVWVVLRQGYGTTTLSTEEQGATLAERFGYYFTSLASQQFAFGLVLLAVVGAFLAWRSGQFRELALVVLAWLGTGPCFVLLANQPNQPIFHDILDRFYSVSYLLLAGLMGRALAELKPRLTVAVGVGLCLLQGLTHWNAVTQAGSDHLPTTVAAVWQTLPSEAVLIPDSDMTSGAYLYAQEVEGERKDVQILHAGLLASQWYRETLPRDLAVESLEQALESDRQFFFEAVPEGIPGFFVPRGLVYEYRSPGEEIPERESTDRRTYALLDSMATPWRASPQASILRQHLLVRWANAFRTVAPSLEDEQMVGALERVVRLDPKPEDWLQLGLAQVRLGRGPMARQSLERVLELEPGNRLAQAALSRL